jgi:hypothetical protein
MYTRTTDFLKNDCFGFIGLVIWPSSLSALMLFQETLGDTESIQVHPHVFKTQEE